MHRHKMLLLFGVAVAVLGVSAPAWACTRFLGAFTVTGSSGGSVVSTGTDSDGTDTMGVATNNASQQISAGRATACSGLSSSPGCLLQPPGTITLSTARSGAIPAVTPDLAGATAYGYVAHGTIAGGTILPSGTYDAWFLNMPVYVTHSPYEQGDLDPSETDSQFWTTCFGPDGGPGGASNPLNHHLGTVRIDSSGEIDQKDGVANSNAAAFTLPVSVPTAIPNVSATTNPVYLSGESAVCLTMYSGPPGAQSSWAQMAPVSIL